MDGLLVLIIVLVAIGIVAGVLYYYYSKKGEITYRIEELPMMPRAT